MKNASFPRVLTFSIWFAMAFACPGLSEAREEARPEYGSQLDPRKTAYASFVNVCGTDLQDRWRASLDVTFKSATLVTDLRVGESSLMQPVEAEGQGTLEVRRRGSPEVLERIPANLPPGTFCTVVISGMIGHKSDVRALVLRDYPLLENQKRRGMARLLLVSTIGGYQTKVTIGGESIGNLQPGLPRELFITPGEKEIKMFFQDKKFGDRDLHTLSGLAAKPGENCNVIFFDSPQTPGRPNVLAINADQQRNELLESLKPETQSLPKK